jgi:cardiolipin synthase
VEIFPFNTTQGEGNRFRLNFRNLRKIVVIDGNIAYVGGHNVGDEYLGKDPVLTPCSDLTGKWQIQSAREVACILTPGRIK